LIDRAPGNDISGRLTLGRKEGAMTQNTAQTDCGLMVEMRGIYKAFPYVQAVTNGSFELRRGEIHSLIGENGAGKSTLMKILYGLYEKDAGNIIIRGKKMEKYNTHKAIEMGVGMVHQEFMLVNELTVMENIILGYEKTRRFGFIDPDKAKKMIADYIKTYSLEVQPDKVVNNISVGEMQRVEIIKALYRGAEIFILDEPTSVLTPQESYKLFDVLRSMRNAGKTVVFISHKLGEVMEISDRITVMRGSKYITTVNKENTNPRELSQLMVGRDVSLDAERVPANPGEPVLKVKDLFVLGQRALSTIKSISFEVRAGEILGIAGVEGNGQRELAEAIAGLLEVQKGSIVLDGVNITNHSPLKIRDAGLAHIPEDRNLRGLCKDFSVYDNLSALHTSSGKLTKWYWRKDKPIADYGDGVIKKYDIRPPTGRAMAGSFSGGNAQKVVVAREVEAHKKLLIAAQPTRGVDVGAIESIREIINRVKQDGLAVLLISADLDEILSLSDRICVLHEGKIVGEFDGNNVDIEKLGMLMTGGGEASA
jgi:simple sugar transport system ATP-binding protein